MSHTCDIPNYPVFCIECMLEKWKAENEFLKKQLYEGYKWRAIQAGLEDYLDYEEYIAGLMELYKRSK